MPEENNILKTLESIQEQAVETLESIKEETGLENWRMQFLSRKSEITNIMKQIPDLSTEIRPQVGKLANQVKRVLESRFEERRETLKEEAMQRSIKEDQLDVTLPGRHAPFGRLHPATRTLRRIYKIFAEMGFQVYRSPDVETDEYNFELLNIPKHHPARDMWDTFHTTNEGHLLRTHTSPGQIYAMREHAPDPVRVILPGMCYRYEQISARSEIQFNQVEVLAVGRNITFGDFAGTLENFAKRLYGDNVRTRLRPSYFPFTEPSAEMDVECFLCGGSGCPVCKKTGWLEIMGCGMVNPIVLQNGGYDPAEFTGFAAGMGPERITMLMHHIEDIRYFWGNDMRFLEQF